MRVFGVFGDEPLGPLGVQRIGLRLRGGRRDDVHVRTDVVEDEPLRTAEEAATPNLIVTCHAAFCSPEGMVEMRTTSARIARAAVLGEPVWNRVN